MSGQSVKSDQGNLKYQNLVSTVGHTAELPTVEISILHDNHGPVRLVVKH